MLKQFNASGRQPSAGWFLDFPPAWITIHNLKTGAQVRDLSLIAVLRAEPEKLVAVGGMAQEYHNSFFVELISPFRKGQIAHYPTAQMLLKALLNKVCPNILVPKPIMCVHIQEDTTQVEEQALAEAAIQSGARKVFLYTDPLSVMLDSARNSKELKHAIIIHIDPQE